MAPATRALLLAVGCWLTASATFGQTCPFPPPTCPPPSAATYPDLDCDGRTLGYCSPYDRDGVAYGDCIEDGLFDDFWTFYDGDFDRVADGCDPDDIVQPVPDGVSDGIAAHPLCDLYSQDRFQQDALWFYHAYTLLVLAYQHLGFADSVDVIRGDVAQLAWGGSEVVLGPATCVKDDGDVMTDGVFVVNDLLTPPSRTAWYYLARLNSDNPNSPAYPYGFSNCLPRLPGPGGDCQP